MTTKCADCATPQQCAAVGYDCGHDDLKTSEPIWGEAVFTRVHNPALARDDYHIGRADPNILIADDFITQAFNQPSPHMYGQIGRFDKGRSTELFIIFNGRNKQLRYQLLQYRPDKSAFEAQLVTATLGTGLSNE